MKWVCKTIAILILLVTVVLFILGTINYAHFKLEIAGEINQYGYIGIFALSFLMDFLPQYISPHLVMLIASLFQFNILWVLLFVSLGSLAGSVAAFELGKLLGEQVIEDTFGKKAKDSIKRFLNNSGKWFIAISAVSPLPYIPIIFGSLLVERKTFLIYGVSVRVLGYAVYAALLYYVL